MYKLRTKLTAAFAVTAILCVILIGVLSNLQLEYHFKEYVKQNQNQKNYEIIQLMASVHDKETGWNVQTIESIGIFAFKQGLLIQVFDEKNQLIWDAYNNENIQSASQSMGDYNSADAPHISQTFPMIKNGEKLGSVTIAYDEPLSYNQLDLHFIRTLNQIFIVVGLLSSILAILFGAYMSKRISLPITKVIQTAQSIAKGTYNDRVHEESNTIEIKQLTETVNQLALTLEKQENLRKRLTGDVAHELRTPLTTIQSHLEAMIDGVWEPSLERLTSCHEEITRITRLVSDLEKLAHFESENMMLHKEALNLEELLHQLTMTFESAFSQKKINAQIFCDHSSLWGDKDKISQVVINVLSNAVKFTPEGGTITLKGQQLPGGVELVISDTGVGISETDLPLIFERFYRADVSRNRMTGGSGIGLSLVKTIVEAHGGTVEVMSQVNRGTTFKFYFPKG